MAWAGIDEARTEAGGFGRLAWADAVSLVGMKAARASEGMKAAWERGVKPAAVAGVFVLAALAATFPLQRMIAYPFVFLFFGAIMASAWVGGAVSGLAAVLLSALVVNYFFIPPVYSITVAKEAQTFFVAFVLCAVVLENLIAQRKRAEREAREVRARLESMVRERTGELEQSNRELGERERHLRELTEAIPQQIWRAGPAGGIEYLNRPLRQYLGEERPTPEEGLLGQALHADDAALFEGAWQAARATGERFDVEARVRGENGRYRWFLIRGNPRRNEDGRITHWYGIHIDIEEQRRAQQGLVEAQDELLRLEKNLTMAEMAASIAHELNQPLTAVVTHAYACREWLRAEAPNLMRATATAEKIVQESTRASEVVRRVRALFQKEPPACQSMDVNGLIAELARLVREESIRRGVSIRLELEQGLPEVEADAVMIRQVLLNLATNAMEAMARTAGERDLTLRTEAGAEGEVRVAVEDRGPGVAEELKTRIFDPFFSTRTDGTGMGLAICRSIVEAHGSRLEVTNPDGGGARFHFSLRASR